MEPAIPTTNIAPLAPLFEDKRPAPRQAPQPMPASIAVAIVKVQKQIVTLGKEHLNKFADFNYVSVDQIYELVGVKMAEAGLIIIPTELAPTELVFLPGKNGQERWGKFEIGFIYASEKGDTWCDPSVRETLFVRIESGLTFHAAKSLAQKTHLRGAFKIPTGEADLDADAHKGEKSPESVLQPKAPKLSKKESEAKRKEILEELLRLGTPIAAEASRDFAEKWSAVFDTMLDADVEAIRKQYKAQATFTKEGAK